jgi:hypothetical protein
MFRFGDPGTRMYGTMGPNNANMLALWDGGDMDPDEFSVAVGQGPSGGNCLLLSTNPTHPIPAALGKAFDRQTKWGFACRMKVDFSKITASGWSMATFAAATGGLGQLSLRFRNTGICEIVRGANTVIGATTAALSSNVWNHFEFLYTVGIANGTYDMWFNNVNVMTATGVGTQDNSPWADAFFFGCVVPQSDAFVPGSTPLIYFDDIILYDGQPTDPEGNPDIHDQIGDCRLEWLLPVADGAMTQFTSTAGSNFSAVNDTSPDGDASYVYDQLVGNIDMYKVAPITFPGTVVKSLAVVHFAKKSEVGPKSMAAGIHAGATFFPHPNEISLADEYAYSFSNWGCDPEDGLPWTPTKVNAIEVGQKVTL